jgi:hypothetical protein
VKKEDDVVEDEAGDSNEEEDVEFVMGDGTSATLAASSGKQVPGSHNRSFLREDAAHEHHGGAIAMTRAVVDDSKPSHYEADIDAVENKAWRNPGAKLSGWRLLLFGFNFSKQKKKKKKRLVQLWF